MADRALAPTTSARARRPRTARPSAAPSTAALDLFADHGVGGTSLQMIADALGVTKAAVYHQFRTKDAIVLAVVEVQLAAARGRARGRRAAGPSVDAREGLLAAVIDVVVENRRSVSTLQSDPVLVRMLAEHPPSIRMWVRLFRILLGDDVDDRGRIRASVVSPPSSARSPTPSWSTSTTTPSATNCCASAAA